ncbi:helix-turn-helix domain-containing protein, partial [Streptomyces sp. NPDC127049]|uniref:helix-turn-helix domain-containing protein n=1 Tax=Streptomyces sp. NPDC127049 TaxID=3347118 RepID=UPI003660FB70
MSAWKSLSDELDPDIRTFTDRLRQVIDRSGLGVVAVAERTRRDRADWDAYLHARRPVPRSAVVALSDITGADLGPLTAQWEHADRAWKRVLRARAVPEQPSPATAAGRGGGPPPPAPPPPPPTPPAP